MPQIKISHLGREPGCVDTGDVDQLAVCFDVIRLLSDEIHTRRAEGGRAEGGPPGGAPPGLNGSASGRFNLGRKSSQRSKGKNPSTTIGELRAQLASQAEELASQAEELASQADKLASQADKLASQAGVLESLREQNKKLSEQLAAVEVAPAHYDRCFNLLLELQEARRGGKK